MEKTCSTPNARQTGNALHLMINQLSISSLPLLVKNENSIVNLVPSDLLVNTDHQKLAGVIGQLLNTVVKHTSNTVLTVSVKNYSHVTILHIKGNTRFHHPEFSKSLTRIQHLSESIGGTVGITSLRNDITTVALSFLNTSQAGKIIHRLNSL